MLLAIHHRAGSFSDRWIAYCEENNVSYKLVDAYSNDIIQQLNDCDVFMWHHSNYDYRDALFAKQLLYSVRKKGIKVFPDFDTNWHFDDKVGQKYLLEAINAPMVPSYVFFDKAKALEWAEQASFPKVFKLRGGAGSANVKLAKSKGEAKKLIKKSFGSGFSQYEGWSNLKERLRKFKEGKTNVKDVVKGVVRLAYPPYYSKVIGKERGY